MGVLSKLQEKNKIDSQRQRNASWSTIWIFCLISPLLFSYGYEFYISVVKLKELEFVPPFLVLIGLLGFGLPIAAMGNLMSFKRITKFLLLLTAEVWFTWFWVITPLSWFAFLPLVPAFIVLQVQRPRIKAGS